MTTNWSRDDHPSHGRPAPPRAPPPQKVVAALSRKARNASIANRLTSKSPIDGARKRGNPKKFFAFGKLFAETRTGARYISTAPLGSLRSGHESWWISRSREEAPHGEYHVPIISFLLIKKPAPLLPGRCSFSNSLSLPSFGRCLQKTYDSVSGSRRMADKDAFFRSLRWSRKTGGRFAARCFFPMAPAPRNRPSNESLFS